MVHDKLTAFDTKTTPDITQLPISSLFDWIPTVKIRLLTLPNNPIISSETIQIWIGGPVR